MPKLFHITIVAVCCVFVTPSAHGQAVTQRAEHDSGTRSFVPKEMGPKTQTANDKEDSGAYTETAAGTLQRSVRNDYDSVSNVEGSSGVANTDMNWLSILLSGLAGAILTQLGNLWLNSRNRARDRKRQNEEYAVIWLSVLTELWHALGKIEQAARIYLTNGEITLYEIRIVDGLLQSFLSQSRHSEVSQKLYGLYNNIFHFRDSFRLFVERDFEVRLLKKRQETSSVQEAQSHLYLEAALYIGQYRHFDMVRDFEVCLEQLHQFCASECDVVRPGAMPLKVLDESLRKTEERSV